MKIITYYYIHLGRLFCLAFLSVCLLATLHKSYWLDLCENLPEIYHWPGQNWLNLGRYPHQECFWRIFQHWKIGHFSTLLAHISGNCDWMFVKILLEIYLWTRKTPLNFGSHSVQIMDPKLWIQRGSALMEHKVCAVWVLLLFYQCYRTSWKVLDFFLKFPGPEKSWKMSLASGKSWNLPVVQLNQHAFYV